MNFEVELAPAYKSSLVLKNPVLMTGGYGLPNATACGAFVTSPITLRQRPGTPLPRVVEIPGGVLLRTGAANPGLSKILRDHHRAWVTSTIPIIVALAAQGAADWPAMVSQLEHVKGIGGIELHFNPTMDAAALIHMLRAVTELPLLATLDLANASTIAGDCVAAGANTLVIGRPPRGMVMIKGKPWHGRLFGPVAKPLALNALAEIVDLKLNVPLVACGGAHSADDVREFLAAGASAVEIDSAEWIEPGITESIAVELENDD